MKKKELISKDTSQVNALLDSLTSLANKNSLDIFRYKLSSDEKITSQRVMVKYLFADLNDENKEREIIITSEGKLEIVNVLINIHYIAKMADKTKMTSVQILKTLYAKYSLQALMGLYNLNEDFPNVKLRELACNLEINWKINKNDEDFFHRAYMFGLEEYKTWQYYYKVLEAMLQNSDNDSYDFDPNGEGEQTNKNEQGDKNSESDKANNQQSENNDESKNNGESKENKENKEENNQDSKDSKNDSDQDDKPNNDKAPNSPEKLKLENLLKKSYELDDQIQDTSTPVGNLFEEDPEDVEADILKVFDKPCETEIEQRKIKDFQIDGFHRLLNNLLRKERQIRITQTRKTNSYHRINNRRDEKGLILPGKKTVQHGVQKKFAEQLDVFIDISGSTIETISHLRVCYIDIMNYVAKEFHDVGARVLFYNYTLNRIVNPGELFIPSYASSNTNIMDTVSKIENDEKTKLKRVIVFTDGYDNYRDLYDTHDDVQIYKFTAILGGGFKIEQYNRDIDYFRAI